MKNVLLAVESLEKGLYETLSVISRELYPVMSRAKARPKKPWFYCYACAVICTEALKNVGFDARVVPTSVLIDSHRIGPHSNLKEGFIYGIKLDASEAWKEDSIAGHAIVEIRTDENTSVYLDPSLRQFIRQQQGFKTLPHMLVTRDLCFTKDIEGSDLKRLFFYDPVSKEQLPAFLNGIATQCHENDNYLNEISALSLLIAKEIE